MITLLVLSLGAGATTAVFGVINSVLLRPIRFPNSERMVRLYDRHPRWGASVTLSPANFVDWRTQARSFEHLGAYSEEQFTWTGGGEPERIPVAKVTVNLFPLLGIKPVLGSTFSIDQERPGDDRVVLLGHGFWMRHFGGDRSAVGRALVLNKTPYVIAGVLPQGFNFPGDAEVYMPLAFTSEELTWRDAHYINGIALLKPGISLRQAQTEMDGIARRLELAHPSENKDWAVRLVSLLDDSVGEIRSTLWIALGLVACVLLIACANIANLQLARAAGRRKEMAIRAAVGAGRWRIVRQLLTESIALGLAGAALGSALAALGIRLLVAVSPGNIPRLSEIGIDIRVLVFAAGLSVVTGLAFGLAPALGISRLDVAEWLKGTGVVGRRRAGSMLVVADIAIALLLLTGAGLLVNSFLRVRQVKPGLDPSNLLLASLQLPSEKGGDPKQQPVFVTRILERLQVLPGVQHAAAVQNAPFNGNWLQAFQIVGAQSALGADRPSANYFTVTPDYFAALRIPLRKGRLFTESDGLGAGVAIINERLARSYFPRQDAIGKRILISAETPREIVGVVGDVKQTALDAETPLQLYEPYAQRPRMSITLVVRTAADPALLFASVKRAVYEVDKSQPISKMLTMRQAVERTLVRRRFLMLLLTIGAAVVLVLAAAGTYGVIAHAVAERTREIGLRMALGATAASVLGTVLGNGMRWISGGVALGLATSAAACRLLRGMLFEITATDLTTYTAASVVLLGTALGAMYLPARRATRVDPVIVLREE